MWISQKMRPAPSTVDADLGVTTIAGSNVGVVTRGEVRDLPVYGPGGCGGMPENGPAVLVIRGGPGGEELCVAGMRQEAPPSGMRPGELYLHGPGDTSVYLRSDGTIELRGRVEISGEVWVSGEFSAAKVTDRSLSGTQGGA